MKLDGTVTHIWAGGFIVAQTSRFRFVQKCRLHITPNPTVCVVSCRTVISPLESFSYPSALVFCCSFTLSCFRATLQHFPVATRPTSGTSTIYTADCGWYFNLLFAIPTLLLFLLSSSQLIITLAFHHQSIHSFVRQVMVAFTTASNWHYRGSELQLISSVVCLISQFKCRVSKASTDKRDLIDGLTRIQITFTSGGSYWQTCGHLSSDLINIIIQA